MLIIKPNCEHCNKDLPNGSTEAYICSYECTFCSDCVVHVLDHVCPNCGGGFVPRPARPNVEWRAGVSAKHHVPSKERVLKPVNVEEHKAFATNVKTSQLEE